MPEIAEIHAFCRLINRLKDVTFTSFQISANTKVSAVQCLAGISKYDMFLCMGALMA